MLVIYNQNNQVKFWLLNNYKIKIIIEFSNQLNQDSWYLILVTKVLTTYIIRF